MNPQGFDDTQNDRASAVEENRTDAIDADNTVPQDAPAFLRRSFGRLADPEPSPFIRASLLAFLRAKQQFIASLWRRHLLQGASNQTTDRPVGRIGGLAFALLSVLVVVACVCAAIAVGQIRLLKSEIATLHRELMPLRERLGTLEQNEKRKRDTVRQEEAQSNAGTDIPSEGTVQTALSLSRDEVQLIKEYIKAAPSAGVATPAISVGDVIGGAMIPLPSPITGKVPKLIGARFTTRNGAIIISIKNSRRADAVLNLN